MRWLFFAIFVISALPAPIETKAAELNIAIAANFRETAQKLVARFEKESGDRAVIISASSGKLVAQILNGAPIDVFFSADQIRVKRLVEEGFALKEDVFSYAHGSLVLWSRKEAEASTSPQELLSDKGLRHVVIANPRLAPYGTAAVETLEKLGLKQDIADKLVFADNVAQAFAMVAQGSADTGFIASVHTKAARKTGNGFFWPVPTSMHRPIVQDAVLLKRAKDKPKAIAFIRFMKGPLASKIIVGDGYMAVCDKDC